MRPNLITVIVGILIFIVVISLIELYAFKGLFVYASDLDRRTRNTLVITYWVLTIGLFALSVMAMLNFRTWRSEQPGLLMFTMAAFMVVGAPKMVLAFFHLIDDLRMGIQWIAGKLMSSPTEALGGSSISRATFITRIGQVGAGLTFAGFLYGVTLGKFNYRVLSHRVGMVGLPAGFENFKVVQISDAHLGSFLDATEPVKKSIDMINALNPDLIVFTGDLVNVESSEAEPWIPVFKELKAKHGKLSILGNHDYAEYGNMSDEDREYSQKRLKEIHDEMGFKLLLDSHHVIDKDGEQLAIIGVENWGKGFKQKGDLQKALQGAESIKSKILLSHDPTHWEEQVLGKEDIQLTLSGHTHGMQMGIEIPSIGLKFSPARLRYRRWGGLYTEGVQHLHVNRGFGFIGFPGRVGMPPEITVLELSAANQA